MGEQYAILRFEKHRGNPAKSIEDHHERNKEVYASNPDVDLTRSQYNYHLIQAEDSYKEEIDRRIQKSGCRTRKDSIRFIDTLITASPEFFEGKTRKENFSSTPAHSWAGRLAGRTSSPRSSTWMKRRRICTWSSSR